MTRWYEDIEIDRPYPLGEHLFSADDIAAFAQSYEPYPIYFDAEAARATDLDGITASGWHIVAIGQRKMIDRLAEEEEIVRAGGGTPGISGPSPGVNAIHFETPVRPGDTVRYTLTVTGKRKSKSIPGWGLLFNRIEGHNQSGRLVYSADLAAFSKLRDHVVPLRMRLATALARTARRLGVRRKS